MEKKDGGSFLKNRFIVVFTVIVCIISLTFTSCLFRNHITITYMENFVANELIFEDETGKYQIKYHKVQTEYGEEAGGTWYEKSTNTELFKFTLNEAYCAADIIFKDITMGSMSWNAYKKGNITICELYGFYKFPDTPVNENLKFLFNQEFVFKEVAK